MLPFITPTGFRMRLFTAFPRIPILLRQFALPSKLGSPLVPPPPRFIPLPPPPPPPPLPPLIMDLPLICCPINGAAEFPRIEETPRGNRPRPPSVNVKPP
uniref:Uncharacterized protein n=1 Tax=Octopus bimaculoides TaxID=37653 RepID=A0A0L8IE47_OCTBM